MASDSNDDTFFSKAACDSAIFETKAASSSYCMLRSLSALFNSSREAVSKLNPSCSVGDGTIGGGEAVGLAAVRTRRIEAGEPIAEPMVCALGRAEPSREEREVMESSLGCRVTTDELCSRVGKVGVVGVGGRGRGIDGGRVSEGEGGSFIRNRGEVGTSSEGTEPTATEERRFRDGGIPFSRSFTDGRGDSRALGGKFSVESVGLGSCPLPSEGNLKLL